MDLRKELINHYLTKPHYNHGFFASASYILLCIVLSLWHWQEGLPSHLLASGKSVLLETQYYRLFSTTYIHGDVAHLLSNGLSLCFLLYFVGQYFGLWVALGHTFFAGALINFLTLRTMPEQVGLLGASGVVYFLWGLWLSLYLLIERRVSLSRRFMKITAITILMLVPTTLRPGVSYMAHFVGLVCGVSWGLSFYGFNRKKILSFDSLLIPTSYRDGFNQAPFHKEFMPWPLYRPRISGHRSSYLED